MPADQMAMEAWKARGRELNALYEVLTEVVQENAPGFDPVADLRALGAQRDRLQAEAERLRERVRVMAREANERLDWVVRDRNEPDKVLANVSTVRSVLLRETLLALEPADDHGGPHE